MKIDEKQPRVCGASAELLQKGVRRIPQELRNMGFTELRKGQAEPLYYLMSGKDTIVVLPTSLGKSLIYMLATVCMEWKAVVFSPLVALMQDQVQSCWKKGLRAAQLSGLQTEAENEAALGDWKNGKIDILFTAPERLDNPRFRTAMHQLKPDFAVIDECFPGDVELLTSNGFKRFDSLDGSETVAQFDQDLGEVSFVRPEKFIQKPYKGELVDLYSDRGVDLSMTPNHELLLKRNAPPGGWVRTSAGSASMSNFWHIPTASDFRGTDLENTLSPLEQLHIMFQADGSFHSPGTSLFSFTKARKLERFKAICEAGGFKVTPCKSTKPRKKRFIVSHKGIRMSKILSEVFDLGQVDRARARALLDEIHRWDGSDLRNNARPTQMLYYSSVVEENADFVQSLCVIAGFHAVKRIQYDDRKESFSDVHRVFISLKKSHIACGAVRKSRTPYEGDVYCVRVPAGNIVVRRGGKVAIVGNCHVISQWSVSFRHHYVKIGDFIEEFQPKVVGAFTATCPLEVEQDVRRTLGLQDAVLWKYLPRRTNLHLSSAPYLSEVDLAKRVQAVPGKCLVYCATVKAVEEVAVMLQAYLPQQDTVCTFHGQMTDSQKNTNLSMFLEGHVRVVVCTNAFGMGVDVPDIRGVIHRHLPGSIEAASQEAGRAGRDGKDSWCTILEDQDGWNVQEYFFQMSNPEPEDVRKVYNALKSESGNGTRPLKLTMDKIGQRAGVDSRCLTAIIETLTGAGCILRERNSDKVCRIKLEKDLPGNDRLQRFMDVVSSSATPDPNGWREVNLEYIAAELNLTTQTVQNWIRQWVRDSVILYDPPYNGSITHVVGGLDLVDFEYLKAKRKRDRENLNKVQEYLHLPDDQKHDWLEAYFENRVHAQEIKS